MKRPLLIGIVAAAIAIAFVVWWLSPTQVLKRTTHKFLSTVSLTEGSGFAARQMKVYQLNRLLAERVTLESAAVREANGTFDRQLLESAFTYLCRSAKQASFQREFFRSVRVDGDEAVVELRLDVLVDLGDYRPADALYDVEFHWLRAEDGWRLSRAVMVEVEP